MAQARAAMLNAVSIHTPTQGVTLTSAGAWSYQSMFQSTHPRRVWPYNSTPSTSGVSFQSTHPRRVWRLIRPILILIVSFNPHTHAGCDLWTYYYLWLWCCFNPHTHAGCDKTNQTSIDINRVSIHTPTQGVTKYLISNHERMLVSIHTPTQGVTTKIIRIFAPVSFNPHTHAGCDAQYGRDNLIPFLFQSTHPRRVWLMITPCCVIYFSFQSTHPRRVWQTVNALPFLAYQFQSTHPRRVWLIMSDFNPLDRAFQSTHPRRVWQYSYFVTLTYDNVSIHTPTQGVTWYYLFS